MIQRKINSGTDRGISERKSNSTDLSIDNFRFNTGTSIESLVERSDFLMEKGISVDHLQGGQFLNHSNQFKGNIENFIGMAQMPVGLAGPLLIKGDEEASGSFFVPLATTEGALVASYNRGMKAIQQSGGLYVACLGEGVQRAPFFKFNNMQDALSFKYWLKSQEASFANIVSESSNHAKLNNVQVLIEGNSLILNLEYLCGDASGQNMVTICTDRICKYILENSPFRPVKWYIESNYAGDKKATFRAFNQVRGKNMSAEVCIPAAIVKSVLRTTPEAMVDYWTYSTLAVVKSGAIGAQGHIANGLTALFIACGQDVACVSESSIGITRMELTEDGDLYAAVSIPALMVGTVGGGTSLPTQRECLEMLDCYGAGKAKKFAAVCTGLALAGELSIAAAMAADHFTKAHEVWGRK